MLFDYGVGRLVPTAGVREFEAADDASAPQAVQTGATG
ncbi:hypothetical protein M622_05500 [Thauera terpenica 58Eu]|uniref:Uncharacterized protein n=1 Tax=Thauera terpenica 58Eu TaxID=1348657 RepID=S9ZIM1_9RHOO|nr:hypothetical protein M622_05500 [Thauera terpenica 58Eu]